MKSDQTNQVIKANTYINRVYPVTDDSRIIHRQHKFESPKNIFDVHADYWSIGLFNLTHANVSVNTGKSILNLNEIVAIYLPRFSVTEWIVKSPFLNWIYFVSRKTEPIDSVTEPLLIRDFSLDQFFAAISDTEQTASRWVLNQTNILKIGHSRLSHYVSDRLKSSIDKNFRTRRTINDLQDELGFSPSYSSRMFKQAFGLSPVEYRSQLRVMQVSIDLLFKRQTVEHSQHSVGIDDSSYFYKTFKKHLNAKPSQFCLPADRLAN